MMKVTIYIETTLAGTGTRKGRYGAVVEYITKKGEPETREVYGEEEETTWYRSTLAAAVKALELLIHPCEVKLVMDCSFVVNMLNRGCLQIWSKNGWKKANGQEVKNKDQWKELYCFMSMHKITATFSKHHSYKHFLLENMKKEEDKKKC